RDLDRADQLAQREGRFLACENARELGARGLLQRRGRDILNLGPHAAGTLARDAYLDARDGFRELGADALGRQDPAETRGRCVAQLEGANSRDQLAVEPRDQAQLAQLDLGALDLRLDGYGDRDAAQERTDEECGQ